MKKAGNTSNIPSIFVIFGATGDLVTKKIAPALFHLFTKDMLPNTKRDKFIIYPRIPRRRVKQFNYDTEMDLR